MAGQRFRGLYGPGIFYSTHAARAHASAAAGMHTCMNEPASMNRDACMLLLLLAGGCCCCCCWLLLLAAAQQQPAAAAATSSSQQPAAAASSSQQQSSSSQQQPAWAWLLHCEILDQLRLEITYQYAINHIDPYGGQNNKFEPRNQVTFLSYRSKS